YPMRLAALRCAQQNQAGSPTLSFGGEWMFRELLIGAEDEARGAVLAEARDLVFLQDAEGLGRIVRPLYIPRIEDVAQLVAREAIGARVPSIEFGPELRAPVLVPGERRAVVAEIACERSDGVAGVSEFEHPSSYEINST